MVYWNTIEVEQALVGGVLIAIASTISMRTYGKVTGMSEIFNNIIRFERPAKSMWQYCFFVGLITCPNILNWIYGNKLSLGKGEMTFFDSNTFSIE